MAGVEGCHICATYFTFSPWPSIKGKAQKGKVNEQFPENMNISSLLMKDLLYSSLTTFYQAVLAFTNAKTLQTPDCCTCLTLHLIRVMAQIPWCLGDFLPMTDPLLWLNTKQHREALLWSVSRLFCIISPLCIQSDHISTWENKASASAY